jgi:hypothetical protein
MEGQTNLVSEQVIGRNLDRTQMKISCNIIDV